MTKLFTWTLVTILLLFNGTKGSNEKTGFFYNTASNSSDNSTNQLIVKNYTNPNHKIQKELNHTFVYLGRNELTTNKLSDQLKLHYEVNNLSEKRQTSQQKTNIDNQTCTNSSEDFPEVFSEDVLKNGAIFIIILVGIYCFTILAIICDKYFLPCVEVLCEVFNLSQDVAAATFMSIATSTPELFVNIIGTFITKSDIGIGTIVGSSLFNALGVAAIGGLAASKPIQLDWWPLTRDIIIYMCAVSLLVFITWDGFIFWYEALVLFVIYFLYFTIMFNNVRISNYIKKILPKRKIDTVKNEQQNDVTEERRKSSRKLSTISPYGSYMEEPHLTQMKSHHGPNDKQNKDTEKQIDENEEKNLEKNEEIEEGTGFVFPKSGFKSRCLWIYLLPIKLFLFIFIPDPKKYPNLFYVTFVMCIIFIGINSYVVSWMITLIGATFSIPDAVLGFTFLAAGGCLPESISITIMSRRGEGSMGVSNSLGANTMNILMSLGLPWFLKTIVMGTNSKSFIHIQSGSIEYTITGLIGVAILLYLTLYFNKFQLRKRVGAILCTIYLFCISFAIAGELLMQKNCL